MGFSDLNAGENVAPLEKVFFVFLNIEVATFTNEVVPHSK